jgi:ribosomal-protein-alanine N-acetyltransferase
MPSVETARLVLRPFIRADIAALAPIYGDPEVMRYMRTGHPTPAERISFIIDYYIRYWQEHPFGLWAVERRDDGALIGQCGLFHLDNTPEVEVAYLLARDAWGQGYAPEAAAATLRYGFETAGLDRIVAVVRPQNIASQRVLEKIGLRFERVARYYELDVRYYGLARAGWQPDSAAYRLMPDDEEKG